MTPPILTLPIAGMTCAACAVRLEKVLKRLPDVDAEVNFATASARLTSRTAQPPDLAAAMAAGVGHKVLYGSDFPILGRDRYDRMLDKTSLSSGQREALLGRNAEALRRTLLAFREEA